MNPILRLFKSLFKKINYDLRKVEEYNLKNEFPEVTDFEKNLFEISSNYTMTSNERIFSLMKSIDFIRHNNVQGDFVECGVWRGGNLIIFQKFIEKYDLRKKIYAFDTFEGMSKPEDIDKTFDGKSSIKLLEKLNKKNIDRDNNILIADCSLEKVKENFKKFSSQENLICIKGKVEDTLEIKENLPDKISILRLDTDWYASTKKELEVLFPLLEKNGILIIEDIFKTRKEHLEEIYFEKLKRIKNYFKDIYFVEFHNLSNYTASYKCEKILVLIKK